MPERGGRAWSETEGTLLHGILDQLIPASADGKVPSAGSLGVAEFLAAGGKPEDIPAQGIRPDLRKRGAIRAVYDGRYKLSRYFSPEEHHLPRSLEELLTLNDVELFDLESDPQETKNLAIQDRAQGELLLAMNDKLNALIVEEVGEDAGQMLPGKDPARWRLDPDIHKLRM